MYEYFPILAVGGFIGLASVIFIAAYALMKNKREAVGFDRSMKDGEIVKRLLAYARPHIASFIAVLLIMALTIAYDIVSPILVGEITGMVAGKFELKSLFLLVGAYVAILLVSVVCTYFQAVILQKIGQKILSALRERVFSHIESLSHEQLNRIPVGKLVTRVTNDTNAISMMFTGTLVNLIKNAFVVIGIFIAMLAINIELTLMVLCFVPFVILFTVIFRKFSRKAYREVKDSTTDINTYLSENLSGMKITQIFNREEKKRLDFEKRSRRLERARMKQMFVFGIFRPMVYVLYISSVLCLFYLAGRGYIENTSFLGQVITVEILVTFYMYISKFFNPIQSLAEQFNALQSAFASAEKIFSVLDMQPMVVDKEGAIELDEVRGEIEFRDVWFAYNEDEWVLRGVSFKIEAGSTVAFVGSTGSGKTTILSLICRNYDIQRGEILIDGINIKDIKISSLRRHFGQMLQDVFLFSGTVRSNIVLWRDDVSEEEISEACRYVNADKFISRLEGGLDAEVRERGNNFSQGQRQLLSFARTVLHRPSVMILDEATANIDTETELLIQDSLSRMMKIGTMLVVAHRLSTVQHADKIILLSHGKIAEEGTHAELLRLGGKYHKLYMLQYEKSLGA